MKNDYNVQMLRQSLVNVKPEISKKSLWFHGFILSFVWDILSEEKAKKHASFFTTSISDKTEQQQIEEFITGFKAGLLLRQAIELNQMESSNKVILDDPLS